MFSLPQSGHIGTNNLLLKEEMRHAQQAKLLLGNKRVIYTEDSLVQLG